MAKRWLPEEIAGWLGGTSPNHTSTFTLAEAAQALAEEAGLTLLDPGDQPSPPKGARIYPALIAAMREVGAVAKLGEYKESDGGPVKYKFRGVDAVINAVGPALRTAGVIPVPDVQEIRRTPGTTKAGSSKMHTVVKVTYRFTAEDGSFVPVIIEGEANDMGDKGTGKAMSVAYRIALLQLFAIPTDDPDPDAFKIEGDHTPPLSAALVQFLISGVKTDPLDRLEGLWALLTAHVAPDTAIPATDSGMVWWELWAARYRAEVEAAPTKDDLAALWKRLDTFGRTFGLGNGRDVGVEITEAATRWGERQKLAIDEVRDLANEGNLEHATAVLKAHLSARRILPGDSLALLEVLANMRDMAIAQAKEDQAEAAVGPNDPGHPDYDRDAYAQETLNEEQLG